MVESLEIWINGKLIFSRASLGEDPDIAEIVEITRWGHKVGHSCHQYPSLMWTAFQGKSFLHMYLCSVAEGGEPRMVRTDRQNTPLAKRVVMSCSLM